MNRRSFLKKIVAVAAGAVVIPTILKSKLPFKFNHAQQLIIGVDIAKGESNTSYHWVQIKGLWHLGEDNPASEAYLNIVSRKPTHDLGTIAFTNGRKIYRYMKNCTTEQLMAEVLC